MRDNDDDILRRSLDFEVVEGKGHGQPKRTWRRQVEKYVGPIGQKMPPKERSGAMI